MTLVNIFWPKICIIFVKVLTKNRSSGFYAYLASTQQLRLYTDRHFLTTVFGSVNPKIDNSIKISTWIFIFYLNTFHKHCKGETLKPSLYSFTAPKNTWKLRVLWNCKLRNRVRILYSRFLKLPFCFKGSSEGLIHFIEVTKLKSGFNALKYIYK